MHCLITTHVLDTSLGRPAAGVHATLDFRGAEASWTRVAEGETDADGRINDLLPGQAGLAAGIYRLTFDTATYFHAQGVEGFYPSVTIVFEITDPSSHHHVPLLLSPYGYSTYRGS